MARSAHHLSERNRTIYHRTYTALRILDIYATSFLGLPRHLRAVEAPYETSYAPYIDSAPMLIVADANAELLEILGAAIENSYFNYVNTTAYSSYSDPCAGVRAVDGELERWTRKHSAFADVTDPLLPISSE